MTLRLTEQAQEAVQRLLSPGDFAIDATAGNGHDTAFLAKCVGPSGRVWAFDVQAEAIIRSRQLLADQGCSNVELVQASHADLRTFIPESFVRSIAVVMFNLGYLPGGDKTITTSETSTLQALDQACEFVKPGGGVSILVYRGHPGGEIEWQGIQNWLAKLPNSQWTWLHNAGIDGKQLSPQWVWLCRKKSQHQTNL